MLLPILFVVVPAGRSDFFLFLFIFYDRPAAAAILRPAHSIFLSPALIGPEHNEG